MSAVKSESVDGRKLITVSIWQQTPKAAAPMIEAVFEIYLPSGIFNESPCALFPLSTTRTDTRETVALDPDERREVCEAALEKAPITRGSQGTPLRCPHTGLS